MITLHNAVVPFDGDEIVIEDVKQIVGFTVDHSLINSDCTRIEMASGTVFQVKESVDEVKDLMETTQ